jgi:hypothetical protein
LLNAFGIQGLYPIVPRRLKLAARAGGILNIQKALYRYLAARRLPPGVHRNLRKIGGDTDIEYIIDPHKELIRAIIKKSGLLNALLGRDRLDTVLKSYEANRYFILLMLYLCLFNEMFVSGRYDKMYEERSLDISLETFDFSGKEC